LNTRWTSFGLFLALLLAGVVVSCLFSIFLPPSASVLAPTSTFTSTSLITATPTASPSASPTITPAPISLITPRINHFPPVAIYWRRALWEEAIGTNYAVEDFEKDPSDYGELGFPYFTGNGFTLTGKSAAQFIHAAELLPSQNLLHFRDWEYGLTFTFPNQTTVTVLGFDYASQEEWQLQIQNIDIILPAGRNQFVGVVLFDGTAKLFNLAGPQTAQGGLSVDNISYIP